MAQNSTCMLFEGIDKVNTLHDTASTFDLINYKSEKSILLTNTSLIQHQSAASRAKHDAQTVHSRLGLILPQYQRASQVATNTKTLHRWQRYLDIKRLWLGRDGLEDYNNTMIDIRTGMKTLLHKLTPKPQHVTCEFMSLFFAYLRAKILNDKLVIMLLK